MFLKSSRRLVYLLVAVVVFPLLSLFASSPAWTAGNSASDTGTASARIIRPLSIAVFNPNLSFGTIVPDTTNPGTVKVTPEGGGATRSVTGGVTTLGSGGFGTAFFGVTGETGESVKVDYSETAQLNRVGGGGNMTVHIDSSIPVSPFPLPAGGSFLGIGGTLDVAANQPAGSYTGTFNVTVSY